VRCGVKFKDVCDHAFEGLLQTMVALPAAVLKLAEIVGVAIDLSDRASVMA
jgi:hypothetical protein